MTRVGLCIGLLLLAVACVSRSSTPAKTGRAARGATAFYVDGDAWFLGVDVRAARVSPDGPEGEFLPLQLVITSAGAGTTARIGRESFVLETPAGELLPAIGSGEFHDAYSRGRVDVRLGLPFLESLLGRFPSPPYTWRAMDFYPQRNAAAAAREFLDLRPGEVAHGFLYFRRAAGSADWSRGRYRLLFTTLPADETLVIDLEPF